jgi:uncharacterized protein (AIM24 family)
MSDYRTKIDEKAGRGAHFELYQFVRKSYALGGSINAGTAAAPVHIPHGEPVSVRQLRIVLSGGSALLEPGALQYAKGKLSVEVQKNDSGGFFGRAIRSAATGESGFATRYTGQGEVWSEPTSKQFIIAQMDGPGDALILDDKAFYACEASIQVKTHTHRSVSGVLSGNGLMQPKLEGSGVFVVESPVPVDEVEEIELDGSGELIVDGDLMMMYSASLNVELRPLVRGLRNAMRSGEGLVFVFTGRGTVWLTPTMRL